MIKVPNEITFMRMNKSLEQLKNYSEKDVSSEIINVVFNKNIKPDFDKIEEIKYFDDGLNDVQKDVVKKVIRTKDLALILGPPGFYLFFYSGKHFLI
jgi:DNA polymerase alpha-associated DNA helicase A